MRILRRIWRLDRLVLLGAALASSLPGRAAAADHASAFSLALESITAKDLKRHVGLLADDTFEGREAGSRGGRAAGVYLGKELQKRGLHGGGQGGSYYQSFDAACRNVLAWIEGSDPKLKSEVVLLGAHYDHVGYGNSQNSYGPLGRIHNGADDNASGTAALLEIIEAFAALGSPPKRSLLFAFWDSEEKGLLGSKHWIEQPTVPLDRIRMTVNIDMAGRLRNNRVEVCGVRTGAGLRQLVSRQNLLEPLLLDFTWEIQANSDHWPFFSRSVPFVMLHTGLHDDYHRPSDDADRINHEGLERVSRLVFSVANELANAPRLPRFRAAARHESPADRRRIERPLPPPPSRLGVRWDETSDPAGGVKLAYVQAHSAAQRAGLRAGDRILRLNESDVADGPALRRLVIAAVSPVKLLVQQPGQESPRELAVDLDGAPSRVGMSWRWDDAEPGAVALARVVPGSPADQAALKPNDRIYAVSGRSFSTSDEFRSLLNTLPGPLDLVVERDGRVANVRVELTQD